MSACPPAFPETARLTPLVGRVLGLNPGLMTGPGTNTYLVGARRPILLDTGAGVAGYIALLTGFLRTAGEGRGVPGHPDAPARRPHRGVPDVRRAFPRIPVAKLVKNDAALPVAMEPLADGVVIRGDGVTLHAIYTPGHASDHLCYYLEEERALFTGDLILGGSTTVIPPDDGDLGDYLASLRRVLQLDVQRIYPAHGPVLEPARPVIEGTSPTGSSATPRSSPPSEPVPKPPPTSSPACTVRSPALHPVARLSVLSHLQKLERDGQVIRTSGDPPRFRPA